MSDLTVAQIIRNALLAIHVIPYNATISARLADTALNALDNMLSELAVQGLIVPYSTTDSLALVAGDGDYTIGSGGTFNVARPSQILESTFIRDSGNVDYPIEVISEKKYNAISVKATQSRPQQLYYDSQYPLGIIYFYPIPETTYTLKLVSRKPFTSYTNLTTTVSLPPEYRSLIKWNLALQMCPEFERQPPQIVVTEAARTLTLVKRLNAANRIKPMKMGGIPTSSRSNRSKLYVVDIEEGY